MPYAKDGTPHHSASRAKMHDERNAGPATGSAKPPTKTHTPNIPKEKTAKASGENEGSIEEHVKQHGPAHGLHHFVHEGAHHVVSHHGDGEVHVSKHGSAEEAHEHMGKAMGVGGESQEAEETPDNEESEYASAGSGIPGLNG